MNTIKGIISAAFVSILLLAGCNTKDGTIAPQNAAFLVAHISPDAPNIDILGNGQLLTQDVPYANYLPYILAAPGLLNLAILEANTSNFIINTNVDLQPGIAYSMFTVDSADKMKLSVVKDTFSIPPSDSVKIRFFNFSPNAPALDLVEIGGDTLYSNRSFNDQDVNQEYEKFMDLEARTYNFEVRESATGMVLFTFTEQFEGGRVYTLFMRGFLGGFEPQDFKTGKILNQ